MKLNDVLTTIEPTGARIFHREASPDGDGWILYIGRPNELIFPFATMHCIPIHVPHLKNPDLHCEETNAVLRRFSIAGGKKSPGAAKL